MLGHEEGSVGVVYPPEEVLRAVKAGLERSLAFLDALVVDGRDRLRIARLGGSYRDGRGLRFGKRGGLCLAVRA
jgi:hypothetical protein